MFDRLPPMAVILRSIYYGCVSFSLVDTPNKFSQVIHLEDDTDPVSGLIKFVGKFFNSRFKLLWAFLPKILNIDERRFDLFCRGLTGFKSPALVFRRF